MRTRPRRGAVSEADIVPMIEPEVLIEGGHTLEECYAVTRPSSKKCFEELNHQGIAPEGITILKASMVIAGKRRAKQSTVEEEGQYRPCAEGDRTRQSRGRRLPLRRSGR